MQKREWARLYIQTDSAQKLRQGTSGTGTRTRVDGGHVREADVHRNGRGVSRNQGRGDISQWPLSPSCAVLGWLGRLVVQVVVERLSKRSREGWNLQKQRSYGSSLRR